MRIEFAKSGFVFQFCYCEILLCRVNGIILIMSACEFVMSADAADAIHVLGALEHCRF